MTQQHTEGPWEVKLARMTPDAPIFGFGITAPGKLPYLASAGVADQNHPLVVGKEYRHLITTGFTEEEVEANALLIAAAPDFQEAAWAIRRGSYLDDDVINRHAYTTVSCEALRMLFAALDKSKGIPRTQESGT